MQSKVDTQAAIIKHMYYYPITKEFTAELQFLIF
jgi:hypothetical protein